MSKGAFRQAQSASRLVPVRGALGTCGVRLHRHLSLPPDLEDRIHDPPTLLGRITADREQRIAVQHTRQNLPVRRQSPWIQVRIEGYPVQLQRVIWTVHV